MMGIDDPYTAFCLDEACGEIELRIKNKEVPVFRKHYSSFSDFYKKFDN